MKDAVLVIGATSAMGIAVARDLAARGVPVILAARDASELGAVSADVEIKYRARVTRLAFEATDFESHPSFFTAALEAAPGGLGGVVICHGFVAEADRPDAREIRRIIDVNFTSCAAVLELAAAYFEKRRTGFLAVVSSVAGDRGRQSNYAYGSAKGGLSIYLQGLRNRLFRAGVQVLDVKPGFVDSAMTFGKPGVFLVAKPERVARDIFRALERRRDVIYTPWFWRYIMLIIRSIPEPIFKRMKL